MIFLNGNTKIELRDKTIYKDAGTTAVQKCHTFVKKLNKEDAIFAINDDINEELEDGD